jgi:hypothetical protein
LLIYRFDIAKELENVDKKQEAPKPNLGTESKTSIKIQPVSNKGKIVKAW